ncbi:hypothetical protein Tco_0250621 [Tanacetum coccineum]
MAPPPCQHRSSYSLPPLLLPSASRREDRPEVNLPPWKRLSIALGPRYKVGESSVTAAARPARGLKADYDFVATIDREIRHDPERYVGYGITDSWRDTYEIYTMLDDGRVRARDSSGSSGQYATEERFSDLLEGRRKSVRRWELRAADCTRSSRLLGLGCYADTIERDDSTSGTGHHTTGAGDSFAGTGDGITGAGCCVTGTAGTRWGSCTARAARGGW